LLPIFADVRRPRRQRCIAFVIGAIILVDTDIPGYGIPMPLILTLAGISGLFVFMIVRMGVQARHRPVVSGRESLIGASGEVLSDLTVEGWARIQGEIWQVRSARPRPAPCASPASMAHSAGRTAGGESKSHIMILGSRLLVLLRCWASCCVSIGSA
jgi:hypothetical protein